MIMEIMMLSQDVNISTKFENRSWLNHVIRKSWYYVRSSNVHLTKLHIQQILKNSTCKIILTFKIDVFIKNGNKIKEFMTKMIETVLVLEYLKESENHQNFFKNYFDNFKQFHVVVIGSKENLVSLNSMSMELIENQDYNFNDLTEETQNQLLDKRTVLFQGKKVLLKTLLQKESYSHLKSESLEILIKNENNLEISPRDESNLEKFQEYYIQRQFKRFIQIDKKKLENDKFKAFLIVNSDENFIELSRGNLEKNIHYLKNDNPNENLVWQKSKGQISDLNDYIIQEETFCLFIDESEILNQSERLLIVSTEPGMGKTTILEKIIQDSNLDDFFLKIILNNFTKVLKELKEKKLSFQDKDPMDFILKTLLC